MTGETTRTIRRLKGSLFKRKRKTTKKRAMPIYSYSPNIGMPLRKFQTLSYFEQLVFTPASSGAHSTYVWNLNSLFDPNFTGTGHQPLGFDQLALLYKQYRVHSAKVTVEFGNTETNVFSMYCGIAGDKSGSLDASLQTKIEASKGTLAHLMLANSRERKSFTRTFNMKKYFSVKNVSDDHQLQAVTTASPTLPAYFNAWLQFPNGHPVLTSKPMTVSVKIQYNCEFFDPIEITGS